ncbi:MAG: DUF116 domain-containing protein [Bacteroidales bacterium]|nr:DUF116 domain-containing protein [Bacteroidales bacterium]
MYFNKTMVYSLSGTNGNSENYYTDIDKFGTYLLGEMDRKTGPLADRYSSFISNTFKQEIPSREIVLFEALMLGVFWNTYGGFAAGTGKLAGGFMLHTANLRRQGGIRRKYADVTRGIFAYRLLEKPENSNAFLFPDTTGLKKLILWMEATGEFHHEAKVFSRWLGFFESESRTYTFINICILRGIATWFKTESLLILGPYTDGVNGFLREAKKGMRFREYKISVIRQRIEYHLNMLGAFVYNSSMRNEFLNCREKVVLLPACMKARASHNCKSLHKDGSETCTGCTNECQVNRIRLLGLVHDFNVEIIGHSSEIMVNKKYGQSGTGIIGVACAATVIAGGLQLTDKGIAAQCVLLNHCGCRHWGKETVATSIDINELLFRAGVSKLPAAESFKRRKFEPEEIAA